MLFARGFAFFPAFKNIPQALEEELAEWSIKRLGSYVLMTHPDASVYLSEGSSGYVVLLGNAVDPFGLETEAGIVANLTNLLSLCDDKERLSDSFLDYVDKITGRFQILVLRDSGTFALCDAIGMVPLYFYSESDQVSFSSHAQLLAELMGCDKDPLVERIVESPFYLVGRRHLPGHKSPYKNIEMVGANVYYSSILRRRVRIFPREKHVDDLRVSQERTLSEKVDFVSSVLKSGAELYVKSREVRVSLSLGQDSRMNLAALYNHQDNFSAYSYCGDSTESAEAEKAHEFALQLGVKHDIIRTDNIADDARESMRRLLDRNSAFIRKHKDSEVDKLVALSGWFPKNAIEFKGEASEVGRATYSKRTGLKKLPPLTSRGMTNLYKRILFPRAMLKEVDQCFDRFLEDSDMKGGLSRFGYDDYDIFFWEHRSACCVSLGIQDHDTYHDTTALMNNREVLNCFLSVDFSGRLEDQLHRAACEKMWPGILSVPTSRRSSLKSKAKVFAEAVFFNINRF